MTIAIGIPAATAVERQEESSDPGIIVIDEVIGMMITALALGPNLWNLFCAFLAFRFFDILKPWPCRRLEKLPEGYGVVADDVFAGLYALGVMTALRSLDILL